MSVVFDEVLATVPPRTEAPAPTVPTAPPRSESQDLRRLAADLALLRERALRVRAS